MVLPTIYHRISIPQPSSRNYSVYNHSFVTKEPWESALSNLTSTGDYCKQSKIKCFNFLSKNIPWKTIAILKKKKPFLMEMPDFRTKSHIYFLICQKSTIPSQWKSSISECMELRMPETSFAVNINNDKFSQLVVKWPFMAKMSNDLPDSLQSFVSVLCICLWWTFLV